MNKFTLYLMCCVVFWCCSYAQAQQEETPQIVSLVSDPWPPYVLGELGANATGGVGIELLHEIFSRLEHVKLETPIVPWNRALREVERGTKDGIGIILKTPERLEKLVYSDELFYSYNSVWYTSDTFPEGFSWRRYDDLLRYSVGIVRGSSYGDELDRLVRYEFLRSTQVSSAKQLFAMLQKGRIDLAIADNLVGDSFRNQFAEEGFELLNAKKPAELEVFHLAFSKRSEARKLIPAINKIIKDLREEGVIERLVGNAQHTHAQHSHAQ